MKSGTMKKTKKKKNATLEPAHPMKTAKKRDSIKFVGLVGEKNQVHAVGGPL